MVIQQSVSEYGSLCSFFTVRLSVATEAHNIKSVQKPPSPHPAYFGDLEHHNRTRHPCGDLVASSISEDRPGPRFFQSWKRVSVVLCLGGDCAFLICKWVVVKENCGGERGEGWRGRGRGRQRPPRQVAPGTLKPFVMRRR
ncbi:hypothetical protein E2C01_020557 [Portunus trituberculatus]|uniref:Uncharacterized protein n=1 Tax=Portunus trituberculatus TaxID=210409 RepID=A0A5B7E219_PORTR|nr:hypothetical protein [Portunus trituberculatus]